MGLFSSKPKASRPTSRRVYLSKEDRRDVNQLRPLERQLGLAAAGYALLALIVITAQSVNGFSGSNSWRFPLGVFFCVLLAALTWKTNRWLAGVGAIGTVYGLPWGRWVLFAFPVLAYFVWLNIRIFRDQRKKMDERAQAGEYGIDPRQAARDRPVGRQSKTEDSAGRSLAPPSKRYTPPKVDKKRK